MWFPFLFRITSWFGLTIPHANMQYVYSNFDGPLYIIPAKTLYNPSQMIIPSLSPQYFAAHLPLYPLIIRLFNFLGYVHSMIFVNLLFTVGITSLFYYVIVKYKVTAQPLILTAVFLFLPRFLVVRSVGAPENMFMFFILLSLLFFEEKKYFLATLFGGLSVITKTPGILLVVVYGLTLLEHFIQTKKIVWKSFWIVLIPLFLGGVFVWYYLQYGDFFAYFHSGDNIHLISPFAVFNFQAKWVGTAWLEDIIFYLFLYGLTVVALWQTHLRSFFYFCLVFFIATLFVQHRDIARYSLPLWPLACIAFERFFTSKKFLIVFVILLPALFLYAWNFLSSNTMPIADWKPFL